MANNSFRSVSAGTTFLSPTDFIVQVDTSAGAVTLILPKTSLILDSFTTIYQYMGIRIVDASNNASVNNITIAGFETNTINTSNSVVLNTNGAGGVFSILGDNQWSFQLNTTSGGSNTSSPTIVNYLGYIYPDPIPQLTGTLTPTIFGTLKIPANTFTIDVFRATCQFYDFFNTPNSVAIDVKHWFNNTPDITGSPELLGSRTFTSLPTSPKDEQSNYELLQKGNVVRENTAQYSVNTTTMPFQYNSLPIFDITQDMYLIREVSLNDVANTIGDLGILLYPPFDVEL